MILDLQNIEHELDLIVNTEGIASKNIIAIGGGFSSGKSAFVSSFFKSNEIELPIGINPVTAIPSYITSGNKNLIKGLSNKGGSIDISTSLYKELSHDFVKSFDFNLKDIMPAMVIETEIEKYDQICFIDTPGYNPAATDGFTSEDKNTAQEFLEQANTLLWLIGLDSNGTIGQTDLDFLEALDLYDKELYIVANKADIRAESDLEDILDEIEESLEDCDILIAGISAYSGNMRKEYTHRKQKLFDFLDSQNKGMEASNNIKKRISYIIEAYRTSINSSKDYHKDISHSFKTIELDMVQYSYEGDIKEEADGLNEKIERLKNKLEKLNSSGQKNKYSSSLASSWLRVAGIQEEAHEDTKKSTKLKQKIKRLEENLEHLSDNLVDNLIQTTYLLKDKLSSTKKIKHLDAQLKTLDEIEVSFMESIDELFINIK